MLAYELPVPWDANAAAVGSSSSVTLDGASPDIAGGPVVSSSNRRRAAGSWSTSKYSMTPIVSSTPRAITSSQSHSAVAPVVAAPS